MEELLPEHRANNVFQFDFFRVSSMLVIFWMSEVKSLGGPYF
jgi:hypothetical protein